MAAGAKTIQDDVVKQTRGKRGQPTKFTPELWGEIIDRIACYENILDICADDHMPHYMTVRAWYRANPQLKADMESAWLDASYLGHSVNDNILRGGVLSTGDFRRDEAIVQNNRWFMGKTSKRLFGDKTTVDLNSTINIAIPEWANATPVEFIQEGEILDPDLLHERETVQRITGSLIPVEGSETPDSEPSQS